MIWRWIEFAVIALPLGSAACMFYIWLMAWGQPDRELVVNIDRYGEGLGELIGLAALNLAGLGLLIRRLLKLGGKP